MEPRPYAFHKMEALVKQMQDPESGVPVGSQKTFLTSIPSAFVGYDLIEWLMEHLNIDDSVEAVHLANQLCQYGYYFPVPDCKTLTVKDDNSLYRFQAAYHWPWHHRHPDNVEYAIYLVKRTLRNKQRHALEDYELEALNNLKRNLQNKWELVTMQAEEQAEDGNILQKNSGACVKVGKERKKMDKQVADSQERAYWRVHRPPPGSQPPLEPSPITNLRRSTSPSQLNTEVDILRRQVAKSRVKVSQAVEGLISYSSTYSEYDPFFTQPQPANPWLSDDPAFWQFNLPIIEVPTEKRVKRWALSFEDLLADPTGVEEFTSYLRKEYSHENIRFWLAVKELRHCSQSQVPIKVNSIHQEFLAHGAPCEINIDSKTQEATLNEMKTPSRFTFDAAAHHVYTVLLNKDCYPRFIRSEQYKNLLANAKHPPTKKRFFGFGGVGKKKSCAGPAVAIANVNKRRGSDRSLTGIVHEAPSFAPQTHIPLSTSQSNLHDITITRDSGVSPERINVIYKEIKQKSMERKQSSEDDRYLSESLGRSEPGPSFLHSEKIISSETKEEPKHSVEKEIVTERKSSQDKIISKLSDCVLGEKDVPPIENIVMIVTEECVEVETSREEELPNITTEEEGNCSLGAAATTTLLVSNDINSGEQDVHEQSTSTILDEDIEPQPLEQQVETKTIPIGTPKMRKNGKKTRLLSEEGIKMTQVQKLSDENKQISIDLPHHSVEDESSEPCKPVQVPADEVVPDDVHSSDTQNRADICPWEDEENCKTEEPFVKKYATLGYL